MEWGHNTLQQLRKNAEVRRQVEAHDPDAMVLDQRLTRHIEAEVRRQVEAAMAAFAGRVSEQPESDFHAEIASRKLQYEQMAQEVDGLENSASRVGKFAWHLSAVTDLLTKELNSLKGDSPDCFGSTTTVPQDDSPKDLDPQDGYKETDGVSVVESSSWKEQQVAFHEAIASAIHASANQCSGSLEKHQSSTPMVLSRQQSNQDKAEEVKDRQPELPKLARHSPELFGSTTTVPQDDSPTDLDPQDGYTDTQDVSVVESSSWMEQQVAFHKAMAIASANYASANQCSVSMEIASANYAFASANYAIAIRVQQSNQDKAEEVKVRQPDIPKLARRLSHEVQVREQSDGHLTQAVEGQRRRLPELFVDFTKLKALDLKGPKKEVKSRCVDAQHGHVFGGTLDSSRIVFGASLSAGAATAWCFILYSLLSPPSLTAS